MDITGFNEQIGFAKGIKKVAKKINRLVPAPKINIKKPTAPVKRVAPVVVKKGGVFSKLKTAQAKQVTATLPKGTAPIVVKKSVFDKVKAIQAKKAVAPVKKSPIIKAADFKKFAAKSPIKSVMPVRAVTPTRTVTPTRAVTPTRIVAPTVMTTRTDAPNITQVQQLRNVTPTQSVVKSLDSTQRSFLKTDLPYQSVTPKTRVVRLKNTPIDLPVNINMIEPPVDGGIADYYGK